MSSRRTRIFNFNSPISFGSLRALGKSPCLKMSQSNFDLYNNSFSAFLDELDDDGSMNIKYNEFAHFCSQFGVTADFQPLQESPQSKSEA